MRRTSPFLKWIPLVQINKGLTNKHTVEIYQQDNDISPANEISKNEEKIGTAKKSEISWDLFGFIQQTLDIFSHSPGDFRMILAPLTTKFQVEELKKAEKPYVDAEQKAGDVRLGHGGF